NRRTKLGLVFSSCLSPLRWPTAAKTPVSPPGATLQTRVADDRPVTGFVPSTPGATTLQIRMYQLKFSWLSLMALRRHGRSPQRLHRGGDGARLDAHSRIDPRGVASAFEFGAEFSKSRVQPLIGLARGIEAGGAGNPPFFINTRKATRPAEH